MGKKSLSDQILDLSNPNTDFDIENDNFNQGLDDEHSESSEDELKNQHYVKTGSSKLRNNTPKNIYGGNKSSRAEIFGDDIGSGGDLEGEEDESQGDEDESEGDEEQDEEQDDDDSEEEGEEEEEEDVQDDSEDSEDSEDNSKDDHKRSALKDLISKERKAVGSRLNQSNKNDALKGYSILQQNNFFDQLIEARIKIQKSVTNSNQLPKNPTIATEYTTSNTSDKINEAQSKCYDLVDNLFKLRNHLSKSFCKKPIENPKKRKLSQYHDTTSKFDSILKDYRSNTLTKWSAKVQNSSGASALNASKFKVINQTAEQQVMNNLNDMERLRKRTRLNRSAIKPLGYTEEEEQLNDDEDYEESNPDLPKGYSENQTRSVNKDEITQIFDDEDFYRSLLNDLVDKKVQASDPTSGVALSLRNSQKSQKNNNGVDTRASKGRKLRYHVQDPIAHFETPITNLKWDDYQIDEFFASLLGQKINMNEAESENEDEDGDEDPVVNDSSIKLFG